MWGKGLTQNVVWYVVSSCCEKAGLEHIAPHDLRRTCAKLCHDSGGELEQIQFLLGHASVQTTERYLGCKQNLGSPVNDRFNLRSNVPTREKDGESVPANEAGERVEKPFGQGIECGHGGSENEQHICDPNKYPYPNEPTWSRSEKAIARAVFDAALKRELQEVMQEIKERANQINERADLWELEHHLTQRRKDIDRRYDFRFSRLTQVFRRLLFEHRVSEGELRPLGEDKRKAIHSCAQFLTEDAA